MSWPKSAVLGLKAVQNITVAVAVAIIENTDLVTLNTTAANALVTLSAANVGDRITILMEADTGDVVITGVFVGGTTLTFADALDCVDMIMTTAGWSVLTNIGAVAIA